MVCVVIGGKDEARQSLRVPSFDGRDGRGLVERVVQLDRMELRRVVTEKVSRLHSLGIETVDPTLGAEGGRAEQNVGHVEILHRTGQWYSRRMMKTKPRIAKLTR